MPRINYRPSGRRFGGGGGKRETDEEFRSNKEDLQSQGLDEQTISAVQSISRADRIDYEVSLYTLHY